MAYPKSSLYHELEELRKRNLPILLGVTGGVASGKTTVAYMFAKLGVPFIDFDLLSRIVMEPNKPAWKDILVYFGEEILLEDKSIDRKKLARIVFQDPEKRKKLESFVHPRIFEEFIKKIKELLTIQRNLIIQVIVPLLLEANLQHFFHKILLVYIPPELQIERLMKRDQIPRELAIKVLKAQWPIDKKKRYADFLIDNSGSLAETEKQVKEIWKILQKWSEELIDKKT